MYCSFSFFILYFLTVEEPLGRYTVNKPVLLLLLLLLLKRVLAVCPSFVSQIAYKNAIQFDNTADEEELLLGTVEAWFCMRLDCVVLLAPLFSYSLFHRCRLCVR